MRAKKLLSDEERKEALLIQFARSDKQTYEILELLTMPKFENKQQEIEFRISKARKKIYNILKSLEADAEHYFETQSILVELQDNSYKLGALLEAQKPHE